MLLIDRSTLVTGAQGTGDLQQRSLWVAFPLAVLTTHGVRHEGFCQLGVRFYHVEIRPSPPQHIIRHINDRFNILPLISRHARPSTIHWAY